MPIIFEGSAGKVVQLRDPAVQGSARFVSLGDAPIGFLGQRSIITRVTVHHQVNLQLSHMIGSVIYVYAFGDRIGNVGLSGISFATDCAGGGPHGAERMLQWYQRNKASRRRSAIRIMIGEVPIEGFAHEFTEDVVDPSIKLVQWGVDLLALPEI